jgi:hypothetical protein
LRNGSPRKVKYEEKFTRLEETRKPALEMAQEEDEKEKESSEDAQGLINQSHSDKGV